jgi:predicted AAA+ superfamily ATPase
MIRRTIHNELLKRLKEKRRFIQVLAGPRQVGKTTVVRQVMKAAKMPFHYASADEPTLRDRTWLEQQWDIARLKTKEGKTRKTGALLVLDEIQKVADWSSIVKLLWDADTHSGIPLKVVLLGSAPLLIQSGLTESLAGRFELIAVPHWSFTEIQEAFGWNLEQYIFYGAYPGAGVATS